MPGFRLLPFVTALLVFVNIARSHASTVVLITQKKGVLLSASGGARWKDFNDGLPDEVSPLGIMTDGRGLVYLSTRDSGLYRSDASHESWKPVTGDLFLMRSRLFPRRYRKISAMAVSRLNPLDLAVAVKHAVYRSADGGKTWSAVPLRGLVHSHYFTALGFAGPSADLYLGTSFNGLYRFGHGTLQGCSAGLPDEPYSKEMRFYEEIGAVACDPLYPAHLFAGLNFGGGLFHSRDSGKTWKRLKAPMDDRPYSSVLEIVPFRRELYVSTSAGVYRMNMDDGSWAPHGFGNLLKSLPEGARPLSALVMDGSGKTPPLVLFLGTRQANPTKKSLPAAGRRGLYASVPSVRGKLSSLLQTMRRCRFNALTIDMKDDFGHLYFPTENGTAREIGTAKRPLDVSALLRRLKDEGVYSIARVVVFKDQALFRAYDHRYAIWNARTGGPWRGNPREFWVDPHSKFVQDYNISIAAELERLGFDEIQFDYIRFPSDGPTNQCLYRYREDPTAFKSEVLSDFLVRAKRSLRAPLSVDIYGFNAWYHFGNWIGQDIEEFARVADVVCPMVYPSHFGSRFYRSVPPDTHPYRIVYESGRRALLLAGPQALIRPYLQAFRMLSPTWGPGYISSQARAAGESGCSGYTFWNAGGEYGMVLRALGE